MTVVQDVLTAFERLLLPKLQQLEAKMDLLHEQQKALREMMEMRFKLLKISSISNAD